MAKISELGSAAAFTGTEVVPVVQSGVTKSVLLTLLEVFTATKLKTARTISLSGAATGSVSFDGSANADIAVTIPSNVTVSASDPTGGVDGDTWYKV